jgi:hypothetical protein
VNGKELLMNPLAITLKFRVTGSFPAGIIESVVGSVVVSTVTLPPAEAAAKNP